MQIRVVRRILTAVDSLPDDLRHVIANIGGKLGHLG
jgi:hypothetical protein